MNLNGYEFTIYMYMYNLVLKNLSHFPAMDLAVYKVANKDNIISRNERSVFLFGPFDLLHSKLDHFRLANQRMISYL